MSLEWCWSRLTKESLSEEVTFEPRPQRWEGFSQEKVRETCAPGRRNHGRNWNNTECRTTGSGRAYRERESIPPNHSNSKRINTVKDKEVNAWAVFYLGQPGFRSHSSSHFKGVRVLGLRSQINWISSVNSAEQPGNRHPCQISLQSRHTARKDLDGFSSDSKSLVLST